MSTTILITVKLSSLQISLSTSTTTPWWPRKAIPRQVCHHSLHVRTQLKHVVQVRMGGLKDNITRRVSCRKSKTMQKLFEDQSRSFTARASLGTRYPKTLVCLVIAILRRLPSA